MGLASQKLSRRLADSLRAIATLQPSMVQVELQQGQIVRAQVSTEEEVASQAAIEVRDRPKTENPSLTLVTSSGGAAGFGFGPSVFLGLGKRCTQFLSE